MEVKIPVSFIGHGSPMNVEQANIFTRSLAECRNHLPRPKSVVVISAHWLTIGTFVTWLERSQAFRRINVHASL